MSAENDSSSSGSEMEQDTPQKLKFGFKGEGDDIMPVSYLLFDVIYIVYHYINSTCLTLFLENYC